MSAILEPDEHVLSTLEKDGTRRWLKPKLSRGKFLTRRRIFGYLLIAIFTVTPFLKVGGKPAILLDITARQFTILGFTFLPTDTLLLALFMVGLLLTVFLLTALLGRLWCGWACPQTVYLELIFRPIERWFDGTPGRGGKPKKPPAAWRVAAKYFTYFVISVYLANTFIAYFIGVDQLSVWVRQSPLQHPVPFLIMSAVTVAMMFDFCFFREQLCIIACPYGRFQSVLLDQNSLVVSYDQRRGEPRGKAKKKIDSSPGKLELPVVGDCVDCGNCVTTCPTGIDIRQGLQMECINCTQCIDACNLVMGKLGREPDLIRYSSQAHDARKKSSFVRPRTVIYPTLLILIGSVFFFVLSSKKSFDAVVLRETGNPHSVADDGQIRNLLKVKVTNRSDEVKAYSIQILEPDGATIEISEGAMNLAAGAKQTFHAQVKAPRDAFRFGRASLKLKIEDGEGVSKRIHFTLIGPYN